MRDEPRSTGPANKLVMMTLAMKAMVPAWLRACLRAQHRNYVFRRAVRMLVKDPHGSMRADSRVLSDLIYGWSNEGWSGSVGYLLECMRGAEACKGPILECGSGVTTIAVGVVAERLGKVMWVLEQDRGWAARVCEALRAHRISSVRVCVTPIKDYNGFAWYVPPEDPEADQFGLVICDGPPAATLGGRYGLLPVMGPRLRPGCDILLDDADRDAERDIATRWAAQLGTTYEVRGNKSPYIRLTVPIVPWKGEPSGESGRRAG